MCSISDIPCMGAALNHISEASVGAVSRGIRYILYYKSNVDKLNSEIEGLNIKEQEIERQVERAKNNGKTIKEHVIKWQDNVKVFKGEVTEFLEKYKSRTTWRCFNVLRCPNPYRRFQLGRWAAKKTTRVSEFSDLEKKQLTGEISYFPPKEYSPISSTEYQNFGSREVAYDKILKALNYKEDGFPVVGVHGFGGVGKTWMMEEASKEVKAKGIFKTVARANVSQVVDIGKIQDQLATYLNITEESKDRTSQLKARLSNGDTILVILDDVWSEIPFTEIGIPFGDSSIKGCKILLTSRLLDVCVDNNCKDPVEIEALTEDEAWGMFTETVGISTIESVDDSLARQVCNKCARLPLIIAAVGKALHKKPEVLWEDARRQLMNCKPENIHGIPSDAYACLRYSFNILHKDAYLCLLLCSLAGEDEEIRIEFLFRLAIGSGLLEDWNALEDARNRVDAMVFVLKSSSLLLEGRYYDCVKVHDIIRDVARSITQDKESEYKFLSESNCHSLPHKVDILSSRKLFYLDFKSDSVYFPDDLVCPDLHTLYLKCSNLSGVQLPDSFFESFPKLKCLSLYIKFVSAVPSSIQKLDRLRSLTIHRCEANDISHIVQLKNLEMLSLRNSCFGGLPLDLGQLRRLRMLDLLGCTQIMGIVLSAGLVCLEELNLPEDCNILDEETRRKTPLSSVTSNLTSLEICFEDVKSCPDDFFCKNLCRYNICVGGNTKFWTPDSAMKSVYFCNDSIRGGVKTLVERGEIVTLKRVTGLQECFSQGEGAFTDLRILNISECMGDEYLSRIHRQPHQRVGSFSKLREITIENSGFKYLFCTSTARCLQQLEKLVIDRCNMMEEIVRNEGQINEIIDFPKLREMRLISLPMFKSFSGKVVFPALKTLIIRALDNITEIWGEEHGHLKEESFCQLKSLEVGGCNKLKNVISYAVRQMLQLEELKIYDCKMMEEIVRNEGQINEVIDFPKLRYLKLRSLPVFKNFCGKVVFPALESLFICALDNITEIWGEEHGHLKEESFCQLKSLQGDGCNKLKNVIPYAVRQMLQLEELKIYDCKMMEKIVRNEGQSNEIIDFPKLRYLDIRSLPVFKNFCGKVVFPALETLYIRGLDNITEIWEEQGHLEESFCQLKSLSVDGCHKLKNVIPYVMCQRLQNLDTLEVRRCDSLISEVQGPNGAEPLVVLPKLKQLDLCRLPKLMETGLNSSDIILYPKLTTLSIEECNNLRNVFLPSVANHYLKLLEVLEITSCEMMNEIIASLGKDSKEIRVDNIEFPVLETLRLQQLPKMNSFWGYGIVEPNLDQQKSSQARKVSFPSLKNLWFEGLKINLEQIIDLGRDSTSKLRSLVVGSESQAPRLIPPNWLLLSRDLETLDVSNWYFHEGDLFSLLGNSSWKNNPYGTISFRRLSNVMVNSCRLSTIFTCSVAKGLQELVTLEVSSCGSIEEIVTDERRNDQLVVDTCDEISFPKLRRVILEDLPNLKSFCPSANYCFKMPSLKDVYITRCPQMLSFTPRQISTPEVFVWIASPSLDGEGYPDNCERTTDINSYLHQIMNTQELFVDKKEELKLNCVDKGKSIVTG